MSGVLGFRVSPKVCKKGALLSSGLIGVEGFRVYDLKGLGLAKEFRVPDWRDLIRVLG